MSREQRRFRREKIFAEVYYQDEKNLLDGGCLAKDISEGGVCIKIKQFFPVGSILELQFKLPLTPEIFHVKGRIMWINKTPFNELWEVGLEIIEDRHYRQLVQQYIYLVDAAKPQDDNDQ
jgi:Tfp pilus assembly protein PilZ